MKPERESEVETAVERAISAIAEAQPEGVLQASREAGEGATLAALSELAKEGDR